MNTVRTIPMAQTVECPRRERSAALVALVLGFVIALALCLAAWLGVRGDGQGNGSIAGRTPGAGGGSGTGTHGDGPGAGLAGDGRGRDGTDSGLPAGTPDGGAADRTPAVIVDAIATTPVEPPRIGFTVPDAPPIVVTPPATPPPSGVPAGNGAPGRSGKGGGGTGTEFMGVRTEASRVVYVIDQSSSMAGIKFAHTKLELRRSIEKIPSDGAFWVVFFDSRAIPMPPGKLVAATAKNKDEGIDWIRQQTLGGGTDPTEAMRLALQSPRPDAIFLMSDGQFQPEPVLDVINRLNADRKVSISTICFHSRDAEHVMKQIAAENRGDYTYVPPPAGTTP